MVNFLLQNEHLTSTYMYWLMLTIIHSAEEQKVIEISRKMRIEVYFHINRYKHAM